MPEERRVALDLLDVRESIEEMGDTIRWIPTDHMLVDCMTKTMPPDAMLAYLKNMQYAFKYDDVIKETKREVAKARKATRLGNIPTEPKTYDEYDANNVNIVDNYDLYYPMLKLLYPTTTNPIMFTYKDDYQSLKKEKGYRDAYRVLVTTLCSDGDEYPSSNLAQV